MRKSSPQKLYIFILVVTAIVCFAYYMAKHTYYSLFEHQASNDILLDISKGDNSIEIAEILAKKELINNKYVFILWAQIQKYLHQSHLIAGQYKINSGSTMSQILAKIQSGDVVIYKLTIPEGLTTKEALEVITKSYGIIDDLPKHINSQGILLPETYFYRYKTKATEMLARASSDLKNFISAAWVDRDKTIEPYVASKEAALILASIIEKEAKADHEKSRISAVYLNRLKRKMRLQADPTVIFALTKGAHFKHILSRQDLGYNSEYNTYTSTGLPPEPICNPGKASIKAALHPAQSTELYFVANNRGEHLFAHSYEKHKANVIIYKKSTRTSGKQY